LWSNFKGNNTRDGLIAPNSVVSSLASPAISGLKIQAHPTPITQTGFIQIELTKGEFLSGTVYNLVTGQFILNLFEKEFSAGINHVPLPNLPTGVYTLSVINTNNHIANCKILVTKK